MPALQSEKDRELTGSLLSSRVTTANHRQRLVTEDGYGTVADSARRDTALPVRLLALEAEPLRGRTGRDDERVGGLGLLVLLELAPVAERARGEVDLRDGLGDDLRAEAERLRAELVHELGPEDA